MTMPGPHSTVKTVPSSLDTHNSVAFHAGERELLRVGEYVREAEMVGVRVREEVFEAVGVIVAVREGDAPRVCVIVALSVLGGVWEAEGMMHVNCAFK